MNRVVRVLVMIAKMIGRGAVGPVNRLVQMPEPSGMDAGVRAGQRGELRRQKRKAKRDDAAKALHFRCINIPGNGDSTTAQICGGSTGRLR